MRAELWWVVVGMVAGCSAQTTPAKAVADVAAVADIAAETASAADSVAETAAKDTAAAEVKFVDATKDTGKVVPCAARAGGYVVDGKCSNGGTSIPYACMLVKGCELTWQTDFRDWTGPLTGNDYTLVNAAKTDTIKGHFDDETSGTYTYEGGTLTCDATMARFETTFASDICCDPVAQACSEPGTACVPIQDKADTATVVTTGCVALADNATVEGAGCSTAAGKLTCKAGLICGGDGNPDAKDAGHCKKLCVAQTDCKAGQNCTIVTTAPKGGVCAAICSPFADKGSATACAATEACIPLTVSDSKAERVMGTRCVTSQGANAGEPCDSGGSCSNGLVCIGKACAYLCDGAHPCTKGSCGNFGVPNGADVAAGFGYCK